MCRPLVALLALAAIAGASESDPETACLAPQSAQECAVRTNNLGSRYYAAGKYHDAEIAFARAIALWGAAAAPEDLAKAYHNLAAAYRMQERYADAAQYYRQAIALRESITGRDDLSLLPLLNELGLVYIELADYAKAEQALRRAIAIVGAHASEATADSAAAMNNLALARARHGREDEAAELYRSALDIYRRIHDSSHQVAVLNNLGELLAETGDYDAAEKTNQEAIALAEQRFGATHPSVASGLSNLGKLMIARHKYSAAEPLLVRAEEIDRRNFAPDHTRIGYDLCNEGAAAFGRKHYADAERLYLESERILEKALPPNHPEVGKILARLANVYRLEGRLEESEALFPRAIQILEQAWGAQSPQLLAILESYEAVLRQSRDYARAEQVEVRSTGIRVAQALRSIN